jgi:hypothetical protein
MLEERRDGALVAALDRMLVLGEHDGPCLVDPAVRSLEQRVDELGTIAELTLGYVLLQGEGTSEQVTRRSVGTTSLDQRPRHQGARQELLVSDALGELDRSPRLHTRRDSVALEVAEPGEIELDLGHENGVFACLMTCALVRREGGGKPGRPRRSRLPVEQQHRAEPRQRLRPGGAVGRLADGGSK